MFSIFSYSASYGTDAVVATITYAERFWTLSACRAYTKHVCTGAVFPRYYSSVVTILGVAPATHANSKASKK